MRDADVLYMARSPLPRSPEEILSELIEQTPWRAEQVKIWGRTLDQPRLVAWYGDAGRTYRYSGILLEPLPWSNTLLDLKKLVEVVCDAEFNSVLLNYYRDNRDSMGLHSDDEPELGLRPVIASLSLGEERTLLFKHKFRKDERIIRLRLGSGSLLLMKDATQAYWKHGIGKERSRLGPRVNLTFRRISTQG